MLRIVSPFAAPLWTCRILVTGTDAGTNPHVTAGRTNPFYHLSAPALPLPAMKNFPFFAAPCCGLALLTVALAAARPEAADGAALGYYRFPALYKRHARFHRGG